MKTINLNLYQFSELSDEAKNKVIEQLRYINVDFEWWNGIYDDAENIGLKITGFDIDRGSCCNADFIDSAIDTANKILSEHGKTCETFKTAQAFLADYKKAESEFNSDEDYDFEDSLEYDYLCDEFKRSICEDYRIILSKEYDYLISDESIIETIEANEYTFLEDGKLY